MNDTEREAVILNSAWAMIDGMVNWSMFVKDDCEQLSNLMFQTRQHSKLFVILLSDFLSQVNTTSRRDGPLGLKSVPSNVRQSDLTFLFHLRQICRAPKLGAAQADLSTNVERFADWLEGSFVAPAVNFSSIEVVTNVCITRYRYIKMCGDIAKHSLPRLEGNVRHLVNLFKDAGHKISEQQAYLAFPDFFDWFHGDIFNYHSSQIAEFLNAIRWAVFDYLLPEFRRSWHLTEGATPNFATYSYHAPEAIQDVMARTMYWDLMNRVRAKPSVRRFSIDASGERRF